MAYTLLRGEVRGGEKLGFSKVRGRNFHSWRWSDLWNSTISNMFVVTVISVNMSNSPKTFSEQLQDLLNNTGTSVNEAINYGVTLDPTPVPQPNIFKLLMPDNEELVGTLYVCYSIGMVCSLF